MIVYIFSTFTGLMNRLAGHKFTGKLKFLNIIFRKHYCMAAIAGMAAGVFGSLIYLWLLTPFLILFRAMSGGEKNLAMHGLRYEHEGRNLYNPWVQIADSLSKPSTKKQRQRYGILVGAIAALPICLMFLFMSAYFNDPMFIIAGLLSLTQGVIYWIAGKVYKSGTALPELLYGGLIGFLLYWSVLYV